MPDALDLGLDLLLLLTRQDVFVPLDDMYASIGKAQGGWLPPVEKASRYPQTRRGSDRHPVRHFRQHAASPQGRADKAGFPNAPATWDELIDAVLAGE